MKYWFGVSVRKPLCIVDINLGNMNPGSKESRLIFQQLMTDLLSNSLSLYSIIIFVIGEKTFLMATPLT